MSYIKIIRHYELNVIMIKSSMCVCVCRFLQLISLVPTDPHVLQRVGEMYDQEGDRGQAYQYHYEVRSGGEIVRLSRGKIIPTFQSSV